MTEQVLYGSGSLTASKILRIDIEDGNQTQQIEIPLNKVKSVRILE
jgi:hypothetical protein